MSSSSQNSSPSALLPPEEANNTCFFSESHRNTAFRTFQEMRSKKELFDVQICSGGRRFPAHRVLLAGTCPLFRQKLAASVPEGSESQKICEEIEVPEDFSSAAVKIALDFMYEGRLALNVTDMVDLLQLMCYLKIDEAAAACERFVVEHLRTSNCVRLLQLSEALELQLLWQKTVQFIEWNFLQVANNEDFTTLTAHQIILLLGSNSLRAKKEDRVYEAVWKWYKSDPEQRGQELDAVLKTVRFRQMSTKFLKSRVLPELVEGEGKCRLDVEEALTSRALSEGNRDFGTPRSSHKIVYLVSMKTNRVETFDEEQRTCVPCPELPSPDGAMDESYHYAALVQEELFILSKMAVFRFNPVTRSWIWVSEGRSVREAGVCSDKQNIYVIGGRPNDFAASKFEVSPCQWSSLPEMIRPRRCAGVAILNHKLYAIGGLNDDGPLSAMEQFNIRSQKWKELSGLLEPRFHMGVATWAGRIFVFGGRDDRHGLKTMEVYHPKEAKWELAQAQLNDSRSEFGYTVYGNKIYCFGGRGVSSVECYDYLNEQWRIVGRVSENTYSVNCLVYPPLK